MFRLAYRNFGDHESVVGNYTVSSGGVAGIRWFELRNVTAGPVTVCTAKHLSTRYNLALDGLAAMDKEEILPLAIVLRVHTIFPQIRYAGGSQPIR